MSSFILPSDPAALNFTEFTLRQEWRWHCSLLRFHVLSFRNLEDLHKFYGSKHFQRKQNKTKNPHTNGSDSPPGNRKFNVLSETIQSRYNLAEVPSVSLLDFYWHCSVYWGYQEVHFVVFAKESFVSLQHIRIKHLLKTTSILTSWSPLWPLLAEDKSEV